MAKYLGTIWEITSHTMKKHEMLRSYFQAWLPIMSKFNRRIVYIDGFAGPGKYTGGEDGSPIVVLKAARDHSFPIGSKLHCVFVEDDVKRFTHLRSELSDLKQSLPAHLSYEVVQGTADDYLSNAFADGKQVDPTFVFIDPFGFSQTPFTTIEMILKHPKCEVLINFMYEEVNRFLNLDSHAESYDDLFGSSQWRRIPLDANPKERKHMIEAIYKRQLSRVARFVHSFEMLNKSNTTDYFLFFATNGLKGLEKMKEAMWAVDNTGGFSFSDYKSSKVISTLFIDHPNIEPLKALLVDRFGGLDVLVESLEDWVTAETPFLPTHLRDFALKPLEQSGQISVINATPKRRRGTFPVGIRLRFH